MKIATFFKLILMVLMVSPTSIFAQTIITSANFSTGLPTGWTNVDNAGSGNLWAFNDPKGRNITAGNFSGNYAILDSDYYGSGASQNAVLTTNTFNTSSYASITLEFDYQYRDYSNSESTTIQVYNGTSWTTIATYVNGDENYSGASHFSMDITGATYGSSAAQVRITYIGSYDWWFALDNLKVTGTGDVSAITETTPTGPGGVGSGNGTSGLRFWIDANTTNYANGANVSAVSNLAGYGNDFAASGSERPKMVTSTPSINNQASFTFNGNNQLKSNYQGNSNESMSFFAVYQATATTDLDIIIQHGGRNTMGINQSNKFSDYVGGSNHTSTVTNSQSWMIQENSFNSSGTSELKYYINNTNTDNFSHNIQSRTSPTWVGGNGTGGGTMFNGSIAEVFKFTEVLNTAQQIIIHNYLSAKYNITLAANDYYTQDNSGAGNFDYHVAGIGRETDGSVHNSAQGTGIIKINTPSDLNFDEYLFWGENAANSTHGFTTNSTDYMDRQNSTWRISKRNDVGTVTLSVAAADLDLSGKQTCATLRLIVSNSASFTNKTTYDLTLSGGIYTATNVSFNDGDYFSFEYQDVIAVDNVQFYNGAGANGKPNTSDACYKLLVKNNATGALTLSENANVREVEIEAGGNITLKTGIHLNVTGNIINNGTFVLEETASLIQQTTGSNANSGAGQYIVTRAGNNSPLVYNIWSSPITTATLTNIFSDANPCDIWTFERTTQAWSHDFAAGFSTTCNGNSVTFSASDVVAGGDGIMDVTGGYFVPGSATASKTFTGNVNNGDYLKPISITSLGNPGGTDWGDDDWNLVGNPYPSALSAGAFWIENAINNNRITDALYFWDAATASAGYNQFTDYASWNLSGGVNSGNTDSIPSGNIGSGQGFWVVGSANTNVVFNNSMRATNNSQFFKRQAEIEKHNAWISFTSPSAYKNNILVGFNDLTTDSVDVGYDAHKLVGNAHVRFASYIGTEEYVIQSVAPVTFNDTKVIRLVVTSDEAGTHKFSGYQRENLPANFKIYLKDKFLDITYDLAQGDYTVELDANIEYTHRFELVFKNEINNTGNGQGTKGGSGNSGSGSTVTGIDETIKSDFTLIQNAEELVLSNPDGLQGEIRIYDIAGRLIWTKTGVASSTSQTVSWSSFTAGTYFITITQNEQRLFITPVVKP